MTTSRMFMQIHIFINTTKKIIPKQRFITPTEFYNKYSFTYLVLHFICVLCNFWNLKNSYKRIQIHNPFYDTIENDIFFRISNKINVEYHIESLCTSHKTCITL